MRSTTTRVRIPATSVLTCAQFAAQVEQSSRQFGSQDRRKREQMLLDTFEGKVAEVAIAELASDFGFRLGLDFALYAEGQTDNGSDISTISRDGVTRLVTKKLDVKGIGSRSSWLLVEDHKFQADVYLLVRHRLSRDELSRMLITERVVSDLEVEVLGFATARDFFAPDGEPYVRLARGERLRAIPEIWDGQAPDTSGWISCFRSQWDSYPQIGPRLDAPSNVGIPASWLRTNFEDLFTFCWDHAIPEDNA